MGAFYLSLPFPLSQKLELRGALRPHSMISEHVPTLIVSLCGRLPVFASSYKQNVQILSAPRSTSHIPSRKDNILQVPGLW